MLSQSKHSETHISSSGGSASTDRHGARVSGPTVSSDVVTKHEIWLKEEDGNEFSFTLINEDIPIREGQKISLIFCGLKDENDGYRSALVNHSSKKHWLFQNADSLIRLLDLGVKPSALELLITIPFILLTLYEILMFLVGSKGFGLITWSIYLVAFSIYAYYKIIPKSKDHLKDRKNLNKHLETLVQQEYQNYK
ncbi:hypothetical protein GCM10007878_13950 [Marinospirillum insulare]|uniref:Uncharacterized protein n=1 Tax=Marinospirillum insulare TaxID=217169 RepID=A0ABQ5ZY66_9GAMM|nr:hypothetical protein GCM10007878_13950 [Marinospirillum insulare]